MGWRGVTRSLIAASRAAERNRTRHSNAVHRASNTIDKASSRLESEIAREIERVLQLETKMVAKPITFGELTYSPVTNDWSSKRFADNTGAIKWSFALKFSVDAAIHGTLDNGGQVYELMAMAATKYGVLLAFKITGAADGRPTKLLNKTSPAANKVFLIADGAAHRAIDGDVSSQVPIGSSLIATIAFPLPPGEPADLSFEFALKAGPYRFKVPHLPPDTFLTARNGPSLVDTLKTELNNATADARTNLDSARSSLQRKSGSGAFWLLVLILVGLVVFFSKV